jgi:hypothetical protein
MFWELVPHTLIGITSVDDEKYFKILISKRKWETNDPRFGRKKAKEKENKRKRKRKRKS